MSRTVIQDGVPVQISDADYAAQFPAQPIPPTPVSGDAIIGALSKVQAAQVDVRDMIRIANRDDVPVTNAKLGRIAKALGTTPDALRAAALPVQN